MVRFALVVMVGLLALYGATTLLEVHRNHKWKPEVDYRSYRAAALTAARGGDIYSFHRSGDKHQRTTPYTYPPLLASVLYPLARLPLALGFYLWSLLMLVTLGIALWLVQRSTALLGAPRPDLLAAAPLLVCPFLLDSNLYWGQVNVLVTALLAGAVLAGLQKRSATAGSLIALAAALKVLPALVILWFVVRRDTRALAGFGGTLVVALLVVPSLVGGPRWAWETNLAFLDLLHGVATEGRAGLQSYYSGLQNGSLMATFDRLFGGSGKKALLLSLSQSRINSLVALSRLILLAVSLGALLRVTLFRQREPLALQLWVLSVSLLVVAGWLSNYLLWDHHLVGLLILLPLTAAVALDPRLRARWRLPLGAGLVAGVLVLTSGFYPGSRRWGVQLLCLLVLWGSLVWVLINVHRARDPEPPAPQQLQLPL